MSDPTQGNVVSLSDRRLERLFANVTPEQLLKWAVICNAGTEEQINEAIAMNISIDDMFSSLAMVMFPCTPVKDGIH